jgi:hypothetical protein
MTKNLLVEKKPWNMKAETKLIVSEAYKFCERLKEKYGQRVTVRQLYYHLFSKGIIPEPSTRQYQRVCRIITKARKRGYIPFDWIEDRSRKPIYNMLYENIEHFLSLNMKRYKKNTWNNQKNFIIILVEKEALAPIVWDIAEKYNVCVFPTKGFSSWSTFVKDIKSISEYFGMGKELVVLVLSDLDPSGQLIKEDYIKKFQFMSKELGFKMPAVFEKIAITPEQVQRYGLPWIRKKYKNRSVDIVELDALPPEVLREIVKESIEKYLDLKQLHEDLNCELEEKEKLKFLIEHGLEALEYD